MPNYTLFYFNGRGRAEICRMLLEAAGAPYVDKRLEFSEWDSYRNDFPGMCLPVLEMEDGYRMTETMAICRHLAREYGFYGRSSLEMLRCDYICDGLYQLMDDYMRFHHWRNGRFRYNMMDEGLMYPEMNCTDMRYPAYDHYMYWRYINTCKRLMPFLERTLETCKSGSQFFLGDQMMWCDMMFYSCMESPFFEDQSIFSNYPLLMSLWLRVAAHPRICNYLNNRIYSMW